MSYDLIAIKDLLNPFQPLTQIKNYKILKVRQIADYYVHPLVQHVFKGWLENIKSRDDRNFCKNMLQFSGI
jgi:antibiotic biosynthesis monooxygenase (ABM) superfamily enzyme